MTQILNELPSELKKEIISYLSIRDILRSSQASKGLKNSCDNDDIWKRVVKGELTIDPKKPDEISYKDFYKFYYVNLLRKITIEEINQPIRVDLNSLKFPFRHGLSSQNTDEKWYAHTALSLAVTLGFEKLFFFCLKNGANLHVYDKVYIRDETYPWAFRENPTLQPLHVAVLSKKPTFWIDIILKNGADINAITYDGSALSIAIIQGNYEVVEYLISKGANVNSREQMDDTPLHRAAHKGDKKIIQLLVKHGAKNEPNSLDIKPSDIAKKNGLDLFDDKEEVNININFNHANSFAANIGNMKNNNNNNNSHSSSNDDNLIMKEDHQTDSNSM